MKTMEELEKAIKDTITKYKEVIFSPDGPVRTACQDKLKKQQALNKKVYDQKLLNVTVRRLAWDGLQKNIVVDNDTMIDRRTGEVLDPQIDSTYWKDKF